MDKQAQVNETAVSRDVSRDIISWVLDNRDIFTTNGSVTFHFGRDDDGEMRAWVDTARKHVPITKTE